MKIIAAMIVKNEARDLPRCLRSIESVVDAIVIVDTGSTDGTLAVAAAYVKKPTYLVNYTGASEQDETGDWKLWDFSKARNMALAEAERYGATHILNIDADDELLTPAALRGALANESVDVWGLQIVAGNDTQWVTHRAWRAGFGIRYEGRCHEYPTIGGHRQHIFYDVVIRHHAEPGFGENSNARNLRILTREFQEKPTPRCAFYLANTHKDAGRWAEAVRWYDVRILMGTGYSDEYLFAHLYKGRASRACGQGGIAHAALLQGLAYDPRWSEFWMELAYIAYDEQRWWPCIGYCLQCYDRPIPETQLWREMNKYTDAPCRIISWCYEHLGDKEAALVWARRAKQYLLEDSEWDQRIARLSAPSAQLPPR